MKGEAFYQGRPTSYWAGRMQEWSEATNEPTPIPPTPNVFVHLAQEVGLWSDPARFPDVARGDPATFPVLCEMVEDPDPVVVKGATWGLGRCTIVDKRATAVLKRLSGHPNKSVQEAAERATWLPLGYPPSTKGEVIP